MTASEATMAMLNPKCLSISSTKMTEPNDHWIRAQRVGYIGVHVDADEIAMVAGTASSDNTGTLLFFVVAPALLLDWL
ncbi:hypothetical protein V6N13_108816 [Hibiscus sabdariffa]|uniref:Uncharacterized protein n=1 Tax=Hibiscus sabdariffa TaxID=183260 RepID=A0ABR2FMW2_9ROSI